MSGLLLSSVAMAAGGSSSASATTTTETNPATSSFLSLGGSLGAGIVGSDGGTHANFGLQAAARLIPDVQNITLGAFYNHIGRGTVQSGSDPTSVNVDSNLNFYGVEGDYFLTSWLPGVHIGARLALGNNSVTTNGISNSSTDLYIGPKIAYDASIGSGLTAGGEATMLFSGGDQAHTTTSILATLKYWIG